MIIILGLFILASCKEQEPLEIPFYSDVDLTPEFLSPNDLDEVHQVEDFEFIDQNGSTFTKKDLEGKFYIANFFFTTCPGICPKLTANMSALQELLSDDDEVMLVSHSVTPEIDTVEQLASYANEHAVQYEKWKLLTGDKSEIYALARGSYYADDSEDPDAFIHTENFYLIDQNFRIRGVYNGTLPLEVERIKEDLAAIKKEN